MVTWIKRRRQLGWMRHVHLSRWETAVVCLVCVPQLAMLLVLVVCAYGLKWFGFDEGADAVIRRAIWLVPDDSALGHAYGWHFKHLLPGETGTCQMMRVGLMVVSGFGDQLTHRVSDRHALIVTNGLRDRLVSTMFALAHARRTVDERDRNVIIYWMNWKNDKYPARDYLDTERLDRDGVTVIEVDHPYDFKVPGHGSLKFSLLAMQLFDLTKELNAVPDWSFFWSNAQEQEEEAPGDHFFHINLAPIVPYLRNLGPPTSDPRFADGELLTFNYGADLAVTHQAKADGMWKVVYDPTVDGVLAVDYKSRTITQQNTGRLSQDSIANIRCLVQFQRLHVGTASSFCDVILAYNMALRRVHPGAPKQTVVSGCPDPG